jgi:hypothetical protein
MGRMSAPDAALVADWLSKNEVTRPTARQRKHYAEMERRARLEFAADDKAYYDSTESRSRVWDPVQQRFCESSTAKRRATVAAAD